MLCVYRENLRDMLSFFFFFNDTATTEIYTLSLHDALPISVEAERSRLRPPGAGLEEPPALALGVPIQPLDQVLQLVLAETWDAMTPASQSSSHLPQLGG